MSGLCCSLVAVLQTQLGITFLPLVAPYKSRQLHVHVCMEHVLPVISRAVWLPAHRT